MAGALEPALAVPSEVLSSQELSLLWNLGKITISVVTWAH